MLITKQHEKLMITCMKLNYLYIHSLKLIFNTIILAPDRFRKSRFRTVLLQNILNTFLEKLRSILISSYQHVLV